MSTGDIAILIIGLVLLGGVIWSTLPRCVYLFKPNAVRSWLILGELPTEQRRKDLLLIDQLLRLGFKPVGTKYEKPPLWSKAIEAVIYQKMETAEFVVVVVGGFGLKYFVESLYTDGQIVLTANGSFGYVDTNEIIQMSVRSGVLEEILDIHREHANKYISKGNTPIINATGDDITKYTQIYYNLPSSQRRMRFIGAVNSLILVASVLIMIWVVF